MEMPRPTEQHRRLERFAGSWSSQEKMYPTAWSPGGSARGRFDFRMGLDGLYLIGDYFHEEPHFKLFGHCLITWDDAKQAYVMSWFDNFRPSVATGSFGDDTLTFLYPEHRMSFQLVDGGFVFKVYGIDAQDKVTPMQEGTYGRA